MIQTLYSQINKKWKKNSRGRCQGTLLDIDFGSYPFVTSSNTITVSMYRTWSNKQNWRSYWNIQAYCTRVESGPFPTELFDDIGKRLGKIGNEFGLQPEDQEGVDGLTFLLKYININGVTQLNMMKADVLSGLDVIKVCTHYMHQGKNRLSPI